MNIIDGHPKHVLEKRDIVGITQMNEYMCFNTFQKARASLNSISVPERNLSSHFSQVSLGYISSVALGNPLFKCLE